MRSISHNVVPLRRVMGQGTVSGKRGSCVRTRINYISPCILRSRARARKCRRLQINGSNRRTYSRIMLVSWA